MSGGWAGSTRRDSLPADWPQRRQDVKTRADGQCERVKGSTSRRCTNPGTDCDHVIRPAAGGTDELDNLEWLCLWHHRDKTSREGNDARKAAIASTKRKPTKHPGLK